MTEQETGKIELLNSMIDNLGAQIERHERLVEKLFDTIGHDRELCGVKHAAIAGEFEGVRLKVAGIEHEEAGASKWESRIIQIATLIIMAIGLWWAKNTGR